MTDTEREHELLEALLDVTVQACYLEKEDCFNSMAISAYADTLRVLEKYGLVKITKKASHRYIFAELTDRARNEYGFAKEQR